MGILYAVAVPLGNLSDITFRAVETLRNVDCIACEDTRNTKILLNKYNISAKVIDCHKYNEKERSEKISEILNNEGSVAIVSDAGTPGICDPGCVLEKELLDKGHKIVPIPGASALTAFLSVVPRDNEFFTFVGFLPKTEQKKQDLFKKFANINMVFYESPNRLKDTLQTISLTFGKNKKIAIARELTKIYEEIKIGSVEEIQSYYETNTLKGEIVGMIFSENEKENNIADIVKDIEILKKQGYSAKDISKILSSLKEYNKNKVYELSKK